MKWSTVEQPMRLKKMGYVLGMWKRKEDFTIGLRNEVGKRSMLGTKVFSKFNVLWIDHMSHSKYEWTMNWNYCYKAQRLAWMGHVITVDEQRGTKSVLEWRPVEKSRRSKSKKKWKGAVKDYIQVIGVRNWRILANVKGLWWHVVEGSKTMD